MDDKEAQDVDWYIVQLPDRLYTNGGTQEYMYIMGWLKDNCGTCGIEWEQGILEWLICFINEEDAIAFKLRFGL